MKKFLPTLLLLILLPAIALAAAGPVLAQVSCDSENYKAACDSIKTIFSQQKPGPWYNQSLIQFQDKVFNGQDGEIFGERYTFAQINWILNSIFAMFLPRADRPELIIGLFELLKQVSQNPTQPPTNELLRSSGLAALFPAAITQMYSFPVTSGIQQTKELADKILSVPTAHAQGIGFSKLQSGGAGTLNIIWSASRNMAYLIAIILLIAAGFMVMFRTQIAPQTVVTVQMMLPKLAISLLLITFSYAIVGFVIDLIYVAIAALIGLLAITGTIVTTGNIVSNITLLATAPTNYIANTFLAFWTSTSWNILNSILTITAIISGVGGLGAIGGAVGGVLGFSLILLGIMVSITIWAVWSSLRIVLTLFISYLHLILLTVFGPLQIMLDLVPGKQSNGFIPWIRCVIGNASVFVMTAVVVIVAQVIFNFPTCSNNGITGGARAGCTPGIFGVNGLFALGPGFTLPFINGPDQIAGNITQVGNQGQIGGGVPLAGWIQGLMRILSLDSSNIFGFLFSRLGDLFILVGYFSFAPQIMTVFKNKLCGKEAMPDIAKLTEPLEKAIGQITGIKPTPIIKIGGGSGKKE